MGDREWQTERRGKKFERPYRISVQLGSNYHKERKMMLRSKPRGGEGNTRADSGIRIKVQNLRGGGGVRTMIRGKLTYGCRHGGAAGTAAIIEQE